MSRQRRAVTPEERTALLEALKKDNPGFSDAEAEAVLPIALARFIALDNAMLFGEGSGDCAPTGLLSLLDEEAPEQPPV